MLPRLSIGPLRVSSESTWSTIIGARSFVSISRRKLRMVVSSGIACSVSLANLRIELIS